MGEHSGSRVSGAWALAGLLAAGCGGDKDADTGATPATGGHWFEDVAEAAGVDFRFTFGPMRHWIPEITGSGVGLFDMDGDGDLDLYALQGCDLAADDGAGAAGNRLFENRGDGTFEDVTERAGVGHRGFGMGCAVGDYDGDGRLDLYVTNVRENVLYRNLGDGRFEDVTDAAGVSCPYWSSSASFLDHDGDGDLDLFVVNYLVWNKEDETACTDLRGQRTYCNPSRYQGPEQDRLYRNNGDGTFTDVSEAAGLSAALGTGLGLVWGEIDGRPGIDVYVANDGMPNQFWSGSPEGVFTDRAMDLGCALSGDGVAEAGMGVCLEDMDRDGRWDLLLTHLGGETNTFYMGGARGFRDRTTRTGTVGASRARTGFGVGMADFDLDGVLDAYVANGRVVLGGSPPDPERPLAEFDQVYRGLGGGRFEELAPDRVAVHPALAVSRGAAFGDIDGDGDVDVCVSDQNAPMRLLVNVAPRKGSAATWSVLERDGLAAVGAVVRFERGGHRIQRQVQRTYSFCASNDPRLHLGFVAAAPVDEVEVTWMDGSVERFGPVAASGLQVLRRGEGR